MRACPMHLCVSWVLCTGAFPEVNSGRGGQFQPDDAAGDQGEAEQAGRVGGFAEQDDAQNRGADGADADPNRIGSADRQAFHGNAE